MLSSPPPTGSLGPTPVLEQGLLVEVDGTVAAPRRLLRVRGELDLATAPLLARAIDRAAVGRREVELDLSGVTFCDVVGLTAIEEAQRQLQDRGCRMSLHGTDGPRHLLLGVDGLFVTLRSSVRMEGQRQPT